MTTPITRQIATQQGAAARLIDATGATARATKDEVAEAAVAAVAGAADHV